ncbi:MAG: flagellar basal body-associated FliL family protein [Methylomonas sp.]|jgi:flagellar FliL protein
MAETHENNEEKKSPKKLILTIVGALLLLAIGAGGGYFYMLKTSKPTHAKGADKAKHANEERAEKEEHEEKSEPDVFYDLPNPLVVDFPSGGSAKVIKISLTIQVKGEAATAALKKNEPMIRNNLLMLISALGADKAKTIEGKKELQASMLSEIGKVLEKMAGKNTAKQVYFTEFVMQ